MSLEELRKRIDEVDSRLMELLGERAELVHGIGEIKKATGAEIYAPEREEALLRRLIDSHAGRLPEKSIRAIYREIMSASLALEKDLKIVYLGPEATWTHQAARGKFGASVAYEPQPSIVDVFTEVERGRADYGVVPVENSTEGTVSHTLDVFVDSDLRICAQIQLPIEHNLLSKSGIEEIRTVYSHPQAFGQCRQWLRNHLPHADLVEASSTTRAAETAASEPRAAAIAGAMAAEHYGLAILEKGIQDDPRNTTRFLVIGRRSCPPTGNDRTSLLFSIKDTAGALFQALEPFNRLGISLSKIESRPSKKKPWEYIFFIDVEGHRDDARLMEALQAIEPHCTNIKILGSYPANAAGNC